MPNSVRIHVERMATAATTQLLGAINSCLVPKRAWHVRMAPPKVNVSLQCMQNVHALAVSVDLTLQCVDRAQTWYHHARTVCSLQRQALSVVPLPVQPRV